MNFENLYRISKQVVSTLCPECASCEIREQRRSTLMGDAHVHDTVPQSTCVMLQKTQIFRCE